MMDATRFSDLIAAHGAEPRRWPEAGRADALRFIAAHPEQAETLLAEARALDAALASARIAAPDTAAFTARMMARPAFAPAVPRWAGMAAALALAVGLGAGWTGAALRGGETADEYYTLAFAGLEEAEAAWLGEEAL
jgi:hypothetical protein